MTYTYHLKKKKTDLDKKISGYQQSVCLKLCDCTECGFVDLYLKRQVKEMDVKRAVNGYLHEGCAEFL